MHAAKPSRDAEFRSLIEAGRLREAAALLQSLLPAHENELRNEIAVWQSGLAELETQRRREAVTSARYNTARQRLLYQLLDIAKACEADAAAPTPREKVFISYNHADADTAQSIKRVLQERGIDVHIDAAEMQPGEDIRAFIALSIRATSCTFCLISQRSLLSGWVGLESMLALTARELWSDRLFAAGYLDTDFFDLGFRLDATRRIDERIAEIDQLMRQYLARRLDTIDLNAERTRALDLRAQLGPILAALRGSLCLDLRPPARNASIDRFCDALSRRAALGRP